MPGQYDISVELDGFKKTTRAAVQLDAAASVTLAFTLEPGALTEVVTVTSDAPPLQTDVTVRKTVEAKDLEQLSFSGRNPLGVPALKAGVIGGNFNNLGFAAFSNGGFNINGGRSDENNITVDGAVAIRTRSAGTIIGIQNVDTLQEVQVLTANYMPEYGRASGGQIRFVTKSGSQNYTGSASFFLRDESLQANSWTRNRSTNAGSRTRARRRSTTSSTATPSAVRFRGSKFEGQAVLLRRAGMGELLPARDARRHGPDRSHAPRRLQRAAEPEQRLLPAGARSSSTRRPASRSRATSSRPTACRRTAWRS